MSTESSKSTKTTKKVFDVALPSATQPELTSKSIIVSHGPPMHDPTIVQDSAGQDEQKDTLKTPLTVTRELNIHPLGESGDNKKDTQPATHQPEEKEIEHPTPPVPSPQADQQSASSEKRQTPPSELTEADQKKNEEATEEAQANHDAKIAELVQSARYVLPINMVEKRHNQRMVALGFVLCLLLVVAWVDIALDAGLIGNSYHVPHSHFFALKH